jgi:hypothetical protein
MKKSLLAGLLVLSGFALKAQSVSPDVISAGGDFFSNLSGSVSWTLGEPMGETFSSTNNFLTQGFQQPWDFGTMLTGSDPVNAEVYPNPTSDFVYLQFGDHAGGSYVIEVFNTLGQQLSSQNFTATPSAKATVSLTNFADGIYFISVKKADGTQTSTYRITKNS